MRAGEKVCIQVMSPTQVSELFASRQSLWMDSLLVMTGFIMIFTGIWTELPKVRAISMECASTVFSVSGPYRCWLPVTNQTSRAERSIMQ